MLEKGQHGKNIGNYNTVGVLHIAAWWPDEAQSIAFCRGTGLKTDFPFVSLGSRNVNDALSVLKQ